MEGYVYKIINIVTGMFYVGSTINIEARFKSHKNSLRKNYHQNRHLQNSYNKHGEISFKYEIVYIGENYQEVEQSYLDTEDWDNLYNLNRNVSGGDILSYHPDREEIVNKIRDSIKYLHSLPKEKNPWANIDVSGEKNPNWKGGVSDPICNCGNTMSVNAKVCKDCRDRTGSNNPFYKKKHSEDTRKLLAEKQKGVTPSNAKKVSIEGTIYNSCAEAGNILSIPTVTVHYRCCKSKNRKFIDWFEVGNPKTETYTPKPVNTVSVICEGVEYSSYAAAASHYNLSITALINRVRSSNYPDFTKKSDGAGFKILAEGDIND